MYNKRNTAEGRNILMELSMSDFSNTIYRHDPSIVSRSIAGETILVPVRKNVGEMEAILTLNETAARAWELIDGQRSMADVLQQMTGEFEVDPSQAGQDLLELTENLFQAGALCKV